MKIGITIRNDLEGEYLWTCNGVSQNIKFYYDLFEEMGHEPFLLVYDNIKGLGTLKKTYKERLLKDVIKEKYTIDVVIEAGININIPEKELLKENCQAKIVGLRCGNQYTFSAEGLFIKQDMQCNFIVGGHDVMWILPHHGVQKSWLAALQHCPCEIVPYIWEPDFVKHEVHDKQPTGKKKVFVMEPNLNVVKNALIPMAILQKLYDEDPDAFEHAFILNVHNFLNKDYFLHNFVNNLPVLQSSNGKVSFSERFSINEVFPEAHVLLGHQVDNDLNNLYKEALYMGIPLVHNAPSYKKMGYYYPDLEVFEGVTQLKQALNNHDPEQYRIINQTLLNDYSIHNKNVQKKYQTLLEQVSNTKKIKH